MNALGRVWARLRLRDPRYAALFDADPSGEVVSVDCETTGLDPRRDEVLTIAAIRISGRRIRCADRLTLTVRPERAPTKETVRVHWLRPVDVGAGMPMAEALPKLLDFVGGRPIVGYFVNFDVDILGRYARSLIGCGLPNQTIEVSRLYYRWRYAESHWIGRECDLKFDTIRADLGLPILAQHDAYNDALSAAMMYVALIDRLGHPAEARAA